MKEQICVYSGSFDPVTLGHVDIIERASGLFSKVVVAALINPAKKGVFSMEQRLEMLRKATAHLPNVQVDSFNGLLADYMRRIGARVVIRGLRSTADFEAEYPMAVLNRELNPEVETLFLPTSPELSCISSGAVREIASFGGDISRYVPNSILKQVLEGIQKP